MTTDAVLDRLGLGRPELRAWVLYDWANSVFMTTVLQVFPIYFARVAAADLAPATATAWFGAATALAMALIAIASPVLGALADAAGLKKPLLGGFVALGVAATSGLWFVGRGDWPLGALLLVLGNIGQDRPAVLGVEHVLERSHRFDARLECLDRARLVLGLERAGVARIDVLQPEATPVGDTVRRNRGRC